MKNDQKIPFAVFVVVETNNGLYAATTRVEGGIGLPGGKIDKGETLLDAAYRECAEEGWLINKIDDKILHEYVVDDKLIIWLYGKDAVKLDSYKEKGRIEPIEKSLEELSKSGFGNEFLINLK